MSYVIMLILMTVGGIVDNFKGGNVQYFYIKFMLGGNENPLMYTIYQIITGAPLGIGAIVIYPLAKKMGIRNVTFAAFVFVLIGSILGWIFPTNIVLAMTAGLLRQIGMIPNAYIFITLLLFAYDSVEYKSGYRLEGLLGIAILTAIQAAIYAPFAGGFESGILKRGFADVVGVTPNADVLSFMTMSFYLFDIILACACLILLPFMNVEKKLPAINAELLRRKKEAVLAHGGVWIEPEEQERIEREKADQKREENRVLDLKERCEKKGLDFETENNKYLAKQAEIREKKHAKQEKKAQLKSNDH